VLPKAGGAVARNQVMIESNILIFDLLIDWVFVSSNLCYFRLVMEREMQSHGLIKSLKFTFYGIS
jgi:hypothetical protein